MNIIACAVVGLVSCAGPATPKVAGADFDPIRDLWGAEIAEINHLEESGAAKAEWAANAEVREAKDREHLENILVYARMSDAEKDNARELLKQGYDMALFSYEGNFNAFVIFEHDKPKLVIKW